jgi:WD40 repeat protein
MQDESQAVLFDRLTGRRVFPTPEMGITQFFLSENGKTAFVYRNPLATPQGAALCLGGGSPLAVAGNVAALGSSARWQAQDWQQGRPLGPWVEAAPLLQQLGRTTRAASFPLAGPVFQLLDTDNLQRTFSLPAWADHLLFERSGQTLRVIDMTSGKAIAQAAAPREWTHVRLSPDGGKLLLAGRTAPGQSEGKDGPFTARGTEQIVRLLELPSLQPIGPPLAVDQSSQFEFSPDGRYVMLALEVEGIQGTNSRFSLFEIVPITRQLRKVLQLAGRFSPPGYYDPAKSIDFSESGNLIADAQKDGSVEIHRLPEGTLAMTCRHTAGGPIAGLDSLSVALAWLDGGTRLLIRRPGRVEIWDLSRLHAQPDRPGSPARRPTIAWTSPDGKRSRALRTVANPPTVEVLESVDAGPLRLVRRIETGLSWQQRLSGDGETLLVLSQGRLRAWDVRTGKRLALPEQPDGPPPRTFPIGNGQVVRVWGDSATITSSGDSFGMPEGSFTVPEDVSGIVPRIRPPIQLLRTAPECCLLRRANGRLIRLSDREPGRALELPAEVTGVQSVHELPVGSQRLVTRPDERTVRYGFVGLDHRLEEEQRFDSPVLYADATIAVATDGQFRTGIVRTGSNDRPGLRDKLPGGPFQAIHLLNDVLWYESFLLAIDRGGKPSLVHRFTPSNGDPKVTVQPMAGTLTQPVLEAGLLRGAPGRLPERLIAARTGDAVFLWDHANPAQPPRRIPEQGKARVGWSRADDRRGREFQHAVILIEDEAGNVTLREAQAPDRPLLQLTGPFAQVLLAPTWPVLAVRTAQGRVKVWRTTRDPANGAWRFPEPITWDVKAVNLLLGPLVTEKVGDSLAVSEGKLFAVLANGRLAWLDLVTGRPGEKTVDPAGPVDRVEVHRYSVLHADRPAETVLRFLTAGPDGTVRVWDDRLEPLGLVHRLGKPVVRVEGVPLDGLWHTGLLVVTEGGPTRLLDLVDGTRRRDFPTEKASSVRLANPYTLLIEGRDGTLRTWPLGADRPTGECSATAPDAPAGPFRQHSTDVLLSVEGRRARLYNSAGVAVGPAIESTTPIRQALLQDQFLLVVGEDGTCRVHDALTGGMLSAPFGPESGFVAAFAGGLNASDGGTRFLIVGAREALAVNWSREPQRLIAFDRPATGARQLPRPGMLLLSFGKEVRLLEFVLEAGDKRKAVLGPAWPHDQELTGAWVFDQGERPVVTLTGKTLRCWNRAGPVGPPVQLEAPPLAVYHTVLGGTPPRLFLSVLTATTYQTWDCRDGKPVGPAVPLPVGPVVEVSVGDGPPLLHAADGRLWRWNVPQTALQTAHQQPLPALQEVAQDSYQTVHVLAGTSRIATRTQCGELRFWDLVDGAYRPGRLQLRGLAGGFPSPPERLLEKEQHLLVVRAGALERWDVVSGQRFWRSEGIPERNIHLWPLEDGDRILTHQVNPAEQVFRLWDGRTGAALTAPITSPLGPMITPDGWYLLAGEGQHLLPGAGSDQRLIRAWRLDTGEPVSAPDLPGDPWRVGTLSPDWRYCCEAVRKIVPPEQPGGKPTSQLVGHRVHDGRTGKPLTPTLPGDNASFSTDGRFILVGRRVYETASGHPVTPADADAEQWVRRPPLDNTLPRITAPAGWTWSLPAPVPDGVLADAVLLAAGNRVDEGGEIVGLSAEEFARLRQGPAGAPQLRAARRARSVAILREQLDVAEQQHRPRQSLPLLNRLAELEPDAADLGPRREQARAELAWKCMGEGDYYNAAQHFQILFRDSPRRQQGADGYNAACAAARIGTAQVRYSLSADDLSLWRRQAHDWLRAALDAQRVAFEKGPALGLARQMAYWEKDADFHAVREPQLLKRLPDDEAARWTALWEDIARLRARGERPGSWKVAGQVLHQEATIDEALWLFGDPKWTDYDFELEVTPTKGTGEVNAVVRAAGIGDFTAAILGGWNNTHHGILPMAGGQWSAWVNGPGKTVLNQWHKVKVEVRGRTCRLFLDGQLIATHANVPSLNGQVGVRTVGTEASFRNLKVTDPSGKVLFEGLPP